MRYTRRSLLKLLAAAPAAASLGLHASCEPRPRPPKAPTKKQPDRDWSAIKEHLEAASQFIDELIDLSPETIWLPDAWLPHARIAALRYNGHGSLLSEGEPTIPVSQDRLRRLTCTLTCDGNIDYEDRSIEHAHETGTTLLNEIVSKMTAKRSRMRTPKADKWAWLHFGRPIQPLRNPSGGVWHLRVDQTDGTIHLDAFFFSLETLTPDQERQG